MLGNRPEGDRPLLDRPILDRPGDQSILGNRPIVNQPIMPSLGEAVLKNEIKEEIVGRHIERAVHVRERIRDLYYRENHPIAYWRNHMWTNHPVWSWWRVTAPNRWANWSNVASWCGYSGSYAQPVNYVYSSEGVYANGKQVNVDDQYSEQARQLAKAGKQLLQQKIVALVKTSGPGNLAKKAPIHLYDAALAITPSRFDDKSLAELLSFGRRQREAIRLPVANQHGIRYGNPCLLKTVMQNRLVGCQTGVIRFVDDEATAVLDGISQPGVTVWPFTAW